MFEKIENLENSLKSQQKQIDDIHEREEWTRKRFEDNERYHEANTEFQEWTRGRFEDNERYHEANTEFQEWTRGRFEDNEKYHEANTVFQEWSRKEISALNRKVDELYKALEKMNMEDYLDVDIQRNIHNKKTYSQSGEDAIISYVLNFIGIDLKKVRYLDLGANHAKELSNSYAYYENGASGVLVEANPELIDELKEIRPRDIIVNKAIAFGDEKNIDFYVMSGDGLSTVSLESAQEAMRANPEIYIKQTYNVETIKVNEILEKYFKQGIDILSIDLEGIEEKILRQIDFEKFRPIIIVLENIEYHPYLVIGDRDDKAGEFLRGKNYIEYAFTGINSIYIDKIAVEKFNNELIEKIKEI